MTKLLSFMDLRKRAIERGLPSDRTTWLRYEKDGVIEFRKLLNGRRVFKDMEEIDSIIDQIEKK